MKNLKIFFLSALVATAGLFTACTEDSDWSAGPLAEGPQAYFSADVPTSYTIGAEDTSVSLPVMRVETAGALDVPVLVTVAEENNGLFTAPANVVFNDGQQTVDYTITFAYAELTPGTTYDVTLTLDDPTMTTPYGYSNLTVSIVVPEPYVLKGTATIWDGLVYTLFTGEVSTPYQVEVYEHLNNPGFLFFKNAYTKAYPTSFFLDFGMTEEDIATYVSYPEEDVYFYLYVGDPNAVQLPTQKIGLNAGYGEMLVGMASAAGVATVEECVGTLKNGVITFPVKKMVIQDNDGMYWANTAGGFKIALPGAVLTDFSLEVAANGHVADKSGQAMPVVNVVGGADVAAVGVKFVAGDVTADYAAVVEEIVAEPTLTNLVEGACTVAGTEPMEAGQVTAVVVPYDANGVAQVESAVAVAFYFAGCGAEIPACEIVAMLDVFSAVFGPGYEEVYPDSSTLALAIMGADITACRISFITGLGLESDLSGEDAQGVLDYVCEVLGATPEELYQALPADYMADINGEYGLGLYFDELDPETPCTVFVEGTNSYGAQTLLAVTGTTAAAAVEEATPAQKTMMGLKMIQYSGMKTPKRVPLR